MRIIFLDVDGVLNNDETEDRYCGWTGIDPKLVDKLKILYDKSNEIEETKIVISSSWRYEKIRKDSLVDGSFDYLLDKLTEKGMEVVGLTPEDKKSGWHRGREILVWLEENKESKNVTTFVILDDESFDFYEEDINLKDYFVQTSFYKDPEYHGGLSDNHIERALRILNGDIDTRLK